MKYQDKIQTIEGQIQHKIDYILSKLDRDPFSRTAGSFDRLYWGWKLKDYPDATLQRLVYPLTKYYYKVENDSCDEEQIYIIQYLIEKNANIEAKDCNDKTPLDIAYKIVNIIKLLNKL